MREQGRTYQSKREPLQPQVAQGGDCLDELIHQHGDEPISTLVQLLNLTSSVEHSLEHGHRPVH